MRRWLDTLKQDLAYGWRSFRRSPGFVAVALLSLTLGTGATSAIFSVIYGVIIDPYPYAAADHIWMPEVNGVDGRDGHTYTVAELRDLQASPAFASVMATSVQPVLLTGEFAPESLTGVLLTANAFNFLGVPPAVGRTIQPSDIRANGDAEPVVVLSHRLWLRLFEGNPGAVGKTLRLNGRPHTIVGVMPPRFGWWTSDGLWLPLSPIRTDVPWVSAIVRLAPGVTAAAAEEQMHAINRRLAEARPDSFPKQGFTTRLRNYMDVTVASGEMRTSLNLLLGAVGFLLLIACVNVANLQLARGVSRAREIAVRMSVGAGRRRLLRQLLTESVLLSVVGGALGVLFAFGAIRAIVALMPEFYVPNESRVAINLPVLAFSLGVSVITGIIAGLVPALQASKTDTSQVLSASRSTGAGGHGARTRSALVIAEVALVGGPPGLREPDRPHLHGVAGHGSRAAGRSRAADERAAGAGALPDARPAQRLRARAARPRPQPPGCRRGVVRLPGQRPAHAVHDRRTEPGRLAAARCGVCRGRPPAHLWHPAAARTDVRRGGGRARRPRGVINEAAAALWPAGQDPVGSRLRLACSSSRRPAR